MKMVNVKDEDTDNNVKQWENDSPATSVWMLKYKKRSLQIFLLHISLELNVCFASWNLVFPVNTLRFDYLEQSF